MDRRLLGALMGLLLLLSPLTANAVELAFWTDTQARAEAMDVIAASWNEAHPDQMVTLSTTVFASDIIDDKMWTTMHSGVLMPGLQQPDIADIDYACFSRYVNPQIWLLFPLNRWLGTQSGAAFSAFTYDGICMGIPVGSGDMAAIYNARALEEAGIDVNEIATWDDFMAAGRRYRRETGNAFFAVDMDSYLVFLTVYQQCAAQGGEAEETYARTLAYLTALFDANISCIMPGGRADSRSFFEAFKSGSVACTFVRRETAALFDAAVRPVPTMGEERGVWIPGHALCVTTFCEDFDLAAAFIEFATEPVDEPGDGVLFPGNTEKILDYIQNYKLELAKMILQ